MLQGKLEIKRLSEQQKYAVFYVPLGWSGAAKPYVCNSDEALAECLRGLGFDTDMIDNLKSQARSTGSAISRDVWLLPEQVKKYWSAGQ